MKRTLITSALPYANGYLHLGHCSGAYLPADMFARYLRLHGEDLLYVCGSDEHGVAITIAAEQENKTPEEIIEKYHSANKNAFEKFGMTFDVYGRTSYPRHHQVAKDFFKDYLDKGLLIEKEEEQFYDPKANMFLPDRYVEGICPNCGYDKARGDQCDSCGAYYNQLDLKNPKSKITGETPVVKKTTHWYLKFNEFQEFLENYIESHSNDWKENVLQQSRSWLKQGLTDRAITRDLNWGVKLDDIAGIPPEKTNGKALYVWFEAVLGYISNTLVWAITRERRGIGSKDDWKNWWQNKDTRYVAFIGKDNIVFHTLIFPALLHARGENYILPDNVPANEFLNLEGQKFSKSRNWSIDLKDFIEDFPETHHIDALRYTLAMNLPETKDADFTWKDFQARNNNELSAIFGNFVNRTLQFVHKNFNGEVPCLPDKYKNLPNDWKNLINCFGQTSDVKSNEGCKAKFKENYSENDYNLIYALWNGKNTISDYYERFRFRDAVSETINVARAANKYFNDEEPWKTLKTNFEECGKSLYVCLQVVRTLSVLFAPVVPFACKKIHDFFEIISETGEPNNESVKFNFWEESILPILPEGYMTQTPSLLFTKIEDDIVQSQIAKLGDKHEQSQEKSIELITIDDFMKIKLRTAKILEAENVKKSKKLIKLIIDVGTDKRQILAGIAEHYKPEDLIGKTIVVVANLMPAKLMGHESNGMMLAANTSDGKLCFVTTETDDIPAGAEVR